MLSSGAFDSVLGAVRADNFALASLWRARARSAVRRVSPWSGLMRVESTLGADKGSMALAPLLHAGLRFDEPPIVHCATAPTLAAESYLLRSFALP